MGAPKLEQTPEQELKAKLGLLTLKDMVKSAEDNRSRATGNLRKFYDIILDFNKFISSKEGNHKIEKFDYRGVGTRFRSGHSEMGYAEILLFAAAFERWSDVEFLINFYTPTDFPYDHHQSSVFYYLALHGKTDLQKKYIENLDQISEKGDVSHYFYKYRDNKHSPIEIAAEKQNWELVSLYLDRSIGYFDEYKAERKKGGNKQYLTIFGLIGKPSDKSICSNVLNFAAKAEKWDLCKRLIELGVYVEDDTYNTFWAKGRTELIQKSLENFLKFNINIRPYHLRVAASRGLWDFVKKALPIVQRGLKKEVKEGIYALRNMPYHNEFLDNYKVVMRDAVDAGEMAVSHELIKMIPFDVLKKRARVTDEERNKYHFSHSCQQNRYYFSQYRGEFCLSIQAINIFKVLDPSSNPEKDADAIENLPKQVIKEKLDDFKKECRWWDFKLKRQAERFFLGMTKKKGDGQYYSKNSRNEYSKELSYEKLVQDYPDLRLHTKNLQSVFSRSNILNLQVKGKEEVLLNLALARPENAIELIKKPIFSSKPRYDFSDDSLEQIYQKHQKNPAIQRFFEKHHRQIVEQVVNENNAAPNTECPQPSNVVYFLANGGASPLEVKEQTDNENLSDKAMKKCKSKSSQSECTEKNSRREYQRTSRTQGFFEENYPQTEEEKLCIEMLDKASETLKSIGR